MTSLLVKLKRLVLLVVFFIILLCWFVFVYTPASQLSHEGFVEIKRGQSFNSLCRNVKADGFVDYCGPLKWYSKFYPELRKIKAGVYSFDKTDTVLSMLNKVSLGKQHLFSVTLIEGKTVKEWLQTTADNNYLTHDLQGKTNEDIAKILKLPFKSAEGLFFPDTYSFYVGQSESEVLTIAFNRMQALMTEAWQSRQTTLPLKSPYEALILASIIEKETGAAKERIDISAVFINRINKKMRLQTDPTVIYGMGDKFKGNITKADLRRKTPYNTYRINGLPPTPIAMPSKAAVFAAVNPSNVDYLYFVSKGNGEHKFSKTLSEHNQAVRKYQLGN